MVFSRQRNIIVPPFPNQTVTNKILKMYTKSVSYSTTLQSLTKDEKCTIQKTTTKKSDQELGVRTHYHVFQNTTVPHAPIQVYESYQVVECNRNHIII